MMSCLATSLLCFIASVSFAAEYVQLTVSGSGIQTNLSELITITSDQSATYMTKEGDDANSSVHFCRLGADVVLLEGSRIVGPAEVGLRYVGTSALSSANVTSVVMIAHSGKLMSDDGIAVVPADNGTPVTVVIETSTDLENWVLAQPGDYAMTNEKRFFRVKVMREEE